MDGGRKVLIGVDETAASDNVLTWAVDNFYKTGDTFVLFHVIPPGQFVVLSTDLGLEEVVEEDEETRKKVEAHARDLLIKRFGSRLEAKGIPCQLELVKFATDNDSIGAVICKRADQLNAAAVILAKHNKGAVKEFFVGSVTNYVTHHCKNPVICLHCD